MNWVEKNPFIAHRGLHSKNIAENSEGAFTLAAEKGYAIELDIQFLSDGTPIVFHDFELDRLTGKNTSLDNLNPQFLQHLRYFDGQRVLRFSEVLKLIDGKVPLLIEIKNETCSPLGLKLILKDLLTYRGRYSLQSFNPKIVSIIKRKAPHISVGLLSTNWFSTGLKPWEKIYLQTLEYQYCIDFISVDKDKLGHKEFFWSSIKKVPLLVWTLRSKSEICSIDQRVSGFIFEGFLP